MKQTSLNNNMRIEKCGRGMRHYYVTWNNRKKKLVALNPLYMFVVTYVNSKLRLY